MIKGFAFLLVVVLLVLLVFKISHFISLIPSTNRDCSSKERKERSTPGPLSVVSFKDAQTLFGEEYTREKGPRIIAFLHVPKTGGKTLDILMEECTLQLNWTYITSKSFTAEPDEFLGLLHDIRKELDSDPNKMVVFNARHTRYDIRWMRKYFGEKDCCKFVFFLREPAPRILSAYWNMFYRQCDLTHGLSLDGCEEGGVPKFERWFAKKCAWGRSDEMTSRMAGMECKAESYAARSSLPELNGSITYDKEIRTSHLISALDSLWESSIGIVERMNESIALLTEQVFPGCQVKHSTGMKIGEMQRPKGIKDIDPKLVRDLIHNNELDYILFNEAWEIFQARLDFVAAQRRKMVQTR